MATRFRLARAADAHHIAEIHASSWRDTYRNLLPASYLDELRPGRLEARWRTRLDQERSGQRNWVVEDHRGIAGFAVIGGVRDDAELAGFAGEVYMLYLHPDRLGAGFGRHLLDGAAAELARRGYYWLVIWVVKANRNACGFYRHMGLRSDGAIRWDEFSGRRVAVVRYAMALNRLAEVDRLIRPRVPE